MASSSKSASTSASYEFDVFLNHRGSDGKQFAIRLYDRLRSHRHLRVFLDRDEMEKGEELTAQIEGAIRASSVNIAIFSPQYCQSSWCLNELLLMLECKRTKGSTILPIFFHVEKGVYGEVLSSLQKKRNRDGQLRYKPEIIGEWKKAFHDVAEISGYELDGKSSYNGDESKLLKDVVEKVLKLVPKPPLDVSIYPTGLEEPEELEEPDELEEPEEEPEELEELELSELESEEEEEPEELEEPDELEEEPEELEELSGLERLESLKNLDVRSCRGLKRIHGLAQLTELQKLVVGMNRDLEELPGIEGSQSLKEVIVFDCPKLKREYESSHRTCRYTFE